MKLRLQEINPSLHQIHFYWDAKLLPDIAGGQHKVDRVALLVYGGGVEKFLEVPAIARGTGEEQANACLSTLDGWQL